MEPKLTVGAVVLCCALAASEAWAQVTYSITDLGVPPGASSTGAYDINASGQVVGAINLTNGYPHAFLYSGGVMMDLGTLGGSASFASRINRNGQIAGYSEVTNNTTYHGFLYNGGTMTDLGTLGGSSSFAAGINNNGEVVGNAALGVNSTHAFLYSGGAMRDLGTLGGDLSAALAINDSGQVVGESTTTNNTTEYGFWYGKGTMTNLGTLGGTQASTGIVGIGNNINEQGQVVGYASTVSGDSHAFLDSGGVVKDLGTLGGSTSAAKALNNRGQVVGNAFTASEVSHAFLYSDGAMADLNSLIDTNAGWTLGIARSINDRGQIVGAGVNPLGQNVGFLLTPFRTLCLSRTGNSLALGWFTNAPVSLSLYQTTDPASGSWIAVTNVPVLTNDQYQVLLSPLEKGSQFFRLQSQ